jgi:hypothetical protein
MCMGFIIVKTALGQKFWLCPMFPSTHFILSIFVFLDRPRLSECRIPEIQLRSVSRLIKSICPQSHMLHTNSFVGDIRNLIINVKIREQK